MTAADVPNEIPPPLPLARPESCPETNSRRPTKPSDRKRPRALVSLLERSKSAAVPLRSRPDPRYPPDAAPSRLRCGRRGRAASSSDASASQVQTKDRSLPVPGVPNAKPATPRIEPEPPRRNTGRSPLGCAAPEPEGPENRRHSARCQAYREARRAG
jgi:hypothetical protein